MENEKKPKKKIWRKIGEAVLEIFGELLVLLIFFAIGWGCLFLIGQKDNLTDWDPELIMVLGILAVLVLAAIVFFIVVIVKNIIRKKKK